MIKFKDFVYIVDYYIYIYGIFKVDCVFIQGQIEEMEYRLVIVLVFYLCQRNSNGERRLEVRKVRLLGKVYVRFRSYSGSVIR